MKSLLILFSVIVCLISGGCTIVNLAPPQQDDALLQRTLEKHFGPEREEAKAVYSADEELHEY